MGKNLNVIHETLYLNLRLHVFCEVQPRMATVIPSYSSSSSIVLDLVLRL